MKLGDRDVPSDACKTVGDILGQIGNKWSILVMVMLSANPWTFNALRREIGVVTQKVLTSTLRGLERDGYVSRTVLPGKLARVEYRLTDLGRAVLKPMNTLAEFAVDRREEVMAAREAYDRAVSTTK